MEDESFNGGYKDFLIQEEYSYKLMIILRIIQSSVLVLKVLIFYFLVI